MFFIVDIKIWGQFRIILKLCIDVDCFPNIKCCHQLKSIAEKALLYSINISKNVLGKNVWKIDFTLLLVQHLLQVKNLTIFSISKAFVLVKLDIQSNRNVASGCIFNFFKSNIFHFILKYKFHAKYELNCSRASLPNTWDFFYLLDRPW